MATMQATTLLTVPGKVNVKQMAEDCFIEVATICRILGLTDPAVSHWQHEVEQEPCVKDLHYLRERYLEKEEPNPDIIKLFRDREEELLPGEVKECGQDLVKLSNLYVYTHDSPTRPLLLSAIEKVSREKWKESNLQERIDIYAHVPEGKLRTQLQAELQRSITELVSGKPTKKQLLQFLSWRCWNPEIQATLIRALSRFY